MRSLGTAVAAPMRSMAAALGRDDRVDARAGTLSTQQSLLIDRWTLRPP